nr:LPS export ABC transporter permease LptF [uncultured Cohaesibacter sp.]
MKLIERYIFFRAATAFLMSAAVLTAIIWLSQALRDMDLVTAKGQTLLIFFSMTSLVLPNLVMVIAPFAVMIAVAYTLNSLNADSELVVINATGASPWVVLKPILVLGLIATLLGGSLSLYAAPHALGTLRGYISQVRADLVARIVKEGIFTQIDDGMTFHIQKREPNGIMRGLFLSDERDPSRHIVYSSEFAQIIETDTGTFLKMDRGTIQQQNHTIDENGNRIDENDDFGSVNIIEFDSYAIDLTKFTGAGASANRYFKPRERSTAFLLNPDLNDPFYLQFVDRARAELHDRFANPLYNLVFATVITAFLAQVRTTRERRGSAIAIAVTIATGLRMIGFASMSLAVQTPWAVPAMYLVPIISIMLSLWVIITGRRIILFDNLIRSIELFNERISRRLKSVAGKPDMQGAQ